MQTPLEVTGSGEFGVLPWLTQQLERQRGEAFDTEQVDPTPKDHLPQVVGVPAEAARAGTDQKNHTIQFCAVLYELIGTLLYGISRNQPEEGAS